jgi:flagellin
MAIGDVSLTAGMRANLVSLQGTVNLLNRTQSRLSTGKKVNTALDNPISFFAAQANMGRASNLSSLKDAMGEAVQTIKAADGGISAISSLIDQAKALGQAALAADPNQVKIQFTGITDAETVVIGGSTYTAALSTGETGYSATDHFIVSADVQTTVANLAALINKNKEGCDMKAIASGSTLILEATSSTTAITDGNIGTYVDVSGVTASAPTTLLDANDHQVQSARATLGAQYATIMDQINGVAAASGYKGTNLLNNNSLNVTFETSALTVKGFSATASDLSLNTVPTTTTSGDGWGWSVTKEINADLGKLDVAKSTLQAQSSSLANNLSVINIQSDFTTNLVNTLTEGANNLTLADMNEEGANMLMLQTRNSLGTTALSLSSQAAQSVLRLFA